MHSLISPAALDNGQKSYRLFIDVTEPGCSNCCPYCYVRQVYAEKTVDDNAIENLCMELINRADFKADWDGTLLTFGSHSDLFMPELFPKFLSALEKVAAQGNPIQISTKQVITEKMAYELACRQARHNQLMVCISCPIPEDANVPKSAREPKAPSPGERVKDISVLYQYSIRNCLLIKPFISGITDSDNGFYWYVNQIEKFRPDSICVGTFYSNDSIKKRMPWIHSSTGSHPCLRHPLAWRDLQDVQTPSDKFIDDLNLWFKGEIPIVKSSPCAIAVLSKSPCPTRVWQEYEELCGKDNCQNCEVLVAQKTQSENG